MKRVIFWEAHPDCTSFPSGGHKIYHERSAIGDMLSAIQDIAMRGLASVEAGLYSYRRGVADMAASSITKNFVVSGEKQVEMFANAIEESYQESLTRDQSDKAVKYRELCDPEEIRGLTEKRKKQIT